MCRLSLTDSGDWRSASLLWEGRNAKILWNESCSSLFVYFFFMLCADCCYLWILHKSMTISLPRCLPAPRRAASGRCNFILPSCSCIPSISSTGCCLGTTSPYPEPHPTPAPVQGIFPSCSHLGCVPPRVLLRTGKEKNVGRLQSIENLSFNMDAMGSESRNWNSTGRYWMFQLAAALKIHRVGINLSNEGCEVSIKPQSKQA